MTSDDDLPLPFGWIKEYDPTSEHHFYVDTKSSPPRSIWVHPYEDEQYLREHPDIREKVTSMMKQFETDRARKELSNSDRPMPERRNSFSGRDNEDMGDGPSRGSAAALSPSAAKKRGFFAKMKDKAIGTKEEREAYRREMARIDMERRKQREVAIRAQQAAYRKQEEAWQRQQQLQRQQFSQAGPSQFGYSGYGQQQAYYPPPGAPYGRTEYVYQQQQQSRGFGGGGGGLALLGGLAGGLLLGDLLF